MTIYRVVDNYFRKFKDPHFAVNYVGVLSKIGIKIDSFSNRILTNKLINVYYGFITFI